jgi:hypothetical protein
MNVVCLSTAVKYTGQMGDSCPGWDRMEKWEFSTQNGNLKLKYLFLEISINIFGVFDCG